eukprot:9495229-Pyramimonas_sp.AAC.1
MGENHLKASAPVPRHEPCSSPSCQRRGSAPLRIQSSSVAAPLARSSTLNKCALYFGLAHSLFCHSAPLAS